MKLYNVHPKSGNKDGINGEEALAGLVRKFWLIRPEETSSHMLYKFRFA